jgi:hypothetical protein
MSFTVRFEPSLQGWQNFSIAAQGIPEIKVSCNHQYDPYPGLVAWLERIQSGNAAIFTLTEPDRQLKLTFMPMPGGDVVGTFVVVGLQDRHVYLAMQISVQALVGTFYCALHQHARSDLYDPSMWESITVESQLMDYTGLNPYSLAELLVTLTQEDFVMLLKAGQGFAEQDEYELQDWDSLAQRQRYPVVKNLLAEKISPWHAAPLHKLTSRLLANAYKTDEGSDFVPLRLAASDH